MKAKEHILITEAIVEIFKTNVDSKQLADKVVSDLNRLYPDYRINFDLEDCDKILRVESNTSIDIMEIIKYGKSNSLEIVLIEY